MSIYNGPAIKTDSTPTAPKSTPSNPLAPKGPVKPQMKAPGLKTPMSLPTIPGHKPVAPLNNHSQQQVNTLKKKLEMGGDRLPPQQKEFIKKQIDQISKRGCLADALRMSAIKLAEDDPADLLLQVTPLLRRMKIPNNKVIQDKVKIVSKTTNKAIYYIPLRRDTSIDLNILRGIKSQDMYFKALDWSMVGLGLWVTFNYTPPEEDQTVKVPTGVIPTNVPGLK